MDFAGAISGTGGLTKLGIGALILSGTGSNYAGATIVNRGVLGIQRASALGMGDGTTATGTTVLGGAILSLQGGITVSGERLKVQGEVVLGQTVLDVEGLFVFQTAPAGTTFTIIDNDGTDAVSGTFANLPQGAAIQVPATGGGQNQFYQINYRGGDGNDVVLTFVGTTGSSGIVLHGTDGNDPIRIGFDFILFPGSEGCTAEEALAGICPHDEIVLFELNGQTTRVEYERGETEFAAGAHWRFELHGEAGNDHLIGSVKNGLLDGGRGDDVLLGGPGDDMPTGGLGQNVFLGGDGIDHISAADGGRDLIFADLFDLLLDLDRGDQVVPIWLPGAKQELPRR